MLAFLNGSKIDLNGEKIINNLSNISIADTAIVGKTFYSSNQSISDLPDSMTATSSFKVITYETIYGNVDFMYQFLLWDGNNGCAWYRSTYAGRNGLKKSSWHKLA